MKRKIKKRKRRIRWKIKTEIIPEKKEEPKPARFRRFGQNYKNYKESTEKKETILPKENKEETKIEIKKEEKVIIFVKVKKV